MGKYKAVIEKITINKCIRKVIASFSVLILDEVLILTLILGNFPFQINLVMKQKI